MSHWRWIWGIHHIQVVKHASERIRPGLSKLGQTLRKVWNGVPVALENGLMSSNFFCERRIYCICDCNLEGINSSIPLLGSCGAICVTVMPKKTGKNTGNFNSIRVRATLFTNCVFWCSIMNSVIWRFNNIQLGTSRTVFYASKGS